MAQAQGAGTRRHFGRDRSRGRPALRMPNSTNSWQSLGLKEPGLDRLIRAGYELLELITYFTVGPKETRAWTIVAAPRRRRPPASSTPISSAASSAPRPSPMRTSSPSAAKSAAKEAGKARDEGKEYVVQDGDILLFRFNT